MIYKMQKSSKINLQVNNTIIWIIIKSIKHAWHWDIVFLSGLAVKVLIRVCDYMHGEISLYQSFHWNHLILCMHNVDTLNICMKKFDAIKILFDKMTEFWTQPFLDNLLLYEGFVRAQIVHAQGNQLVPELLLKQSDTMHAQCWHIEHLHEEVWCHKVLFWQNDIVLIFFYIFYTFVS